MPTNDQSLICKVKGTAEGLTSQDKYNVLRDIK